MDKNLYDKIRTICINQLVDAINGKGLYKARAANGDETAVKVILNNKGIRDIRKHTENFVDALVIPDTYNSINDIFRRLLISGQNRNMMPKVINFMGREEIFVKILGENGKFNYEKVLNITDLHQEFKDNIKGKDGKEIVSDNENSLWHQYEKFIIEAASLMKNISETKAYNTSGTILKKFKNGLDELAKDYCGKYKHQEYLAKKITGMGFALACDFLKEIGGDMAKPDTHIMDYLEKYHSDKLDKKESSMKDKEANKNIKRREAAAVEVMKGLAGQKVYALDKLIWLCCSGNYYKKGDFDGIIVEPKSLKDLFLDKIPTPS